MPKFKTMKIGFWDKWCGAVEVKIKILVNDRVDINLLTFGKIELACRNDVHASSMLKINADSQVEHHTE